MSHETADDLGLLAPIDEIMHPYRERFPATSRIPAQGRARNEVLALMEQLRAAKPSGGATGTPPARCTTATSRTSSS